MSDDLKVRVTVIGRASRRWRGASNQAEADRLNRALSEARAQNLRKPVEDILKRELPGVTIEAPAQGLGSHHGFPLTGEDNAAIDRSVVVMVELTTTTRGTRYELRPAKIYAPSKYWTLKVVSMLSIRGVGYKRVDMTVKVRNFTTGRELTLAGTLHGGEGALKPWGFDKNNPSLQQIGDEVTFSTAEAQDFEYFVGTENGQWVRSVHAAIGLVRKRDTTALEFTRLHTTPDILVFEYKKGWSGPKAEFGVSSGILKVRGSVPSDFIDGNTIVDVPTESTRNHFDGLLLSFPTGKAGLSDLTAKDRERLTDFVTNKARNIAVFAQLGYAVVP